MKVLSTKDNHLLLSITTIDQRIQLSYKNKRVLLDALNKVDIELVDEPIFSENKIVFITPARNDFFTKIKIDPVGKYTEDLTIPDFKDSDRFYNLAKGKNAPFLILDDKFSLSRGNVMSKYLERVESNFRSVYRENTKEKFDLDATKGIDHPINLTSLSDIVFKKLLSPAEDWYYLKQTKLATTDEEYLKARNLTLIDQVDLPFTKNELEKFVDARNAVMHFRVLTKNDAVMIANTAEKIEIYEWTRLLRDLLKNRSAKN